MSSASLRAERGRVVARRDTYQKRKNQVDAVYRNVEGTVAPNPVNVFNRVFETSSSYSRAIKGRSSSLASSIETAEEGTVYSDSRMVNIRSYLQSESSYCQRKINELNNQIADLDRRIAEAVAAEEAARRAAEAAAAAAAAAAKSA